MQKVAESPTIRNHTLRSVDDVEWKELSPEEIDQVLDQL